MADEAQARASQIAMQQARTKQEFDAHIDQLTSVPHRMSAHEVNQKLKRDANDRSVYIVRRLAAGLVTSNTFELLIAGVFIANLVFIIMETDAEARFATSGNDADRMKWLEHVNWGFLFFYCVELLLRFYVERMMFFLVSANIFDLFVVSVDIAFSVVQIMAEALDDMPSISILRVVRFFRLLRLARALMVFSSLRELYVMVHGLTAAARAIFWATVLIFIVLALCSIVAVQLLHPLNLQIADSGKYQGCDRCPRAFSSVAQSILTFVQQIIAGDSWGLVSLPIIEAHPWTLPIFIAVLLCINLGLMNLVLTAIVDQASASREADTSLRLREKKACFNQNRDRLIKVFQALDADGDGLLSYDELSKGYENEECKRIWDMMDVSEEDLCLVYDLMDDDGSGNVDYKEFIEQIHQMQTKDQRILVMLLTASIHKSSDHIRAEIKELREMITPLLRPSHEANGAGGASSSNGQGLAKAVGAFGDVAASPGHNPLTSDSSPQAALTSVKALDRLAQSIEQDVLSSLRDVGRQLEKEVATNVRNSEMLATLTKNLQSYQANLAASKCVSARGILDGCTPVRSRGEPLPRMMDKGAPIGQPIDQRANYTAGSSISTCETWNTGTPSRIAKQGDPNSRGTS